MKLTLDERTHLIERQLCAFDRSCEFGRRREPLLDLQQPRFNRILRHIGGTESLDIPEAKGLRDERLEDAAPVIIIGLTRIAGEKAKQIVQIIKNSKMKVQASIQGDVVRISGKDRDTLQQAIALLRQQDLGIDLQFTNFRTN